MQMNSLQDAFLHELKDIYNAEKQLTRALPKMAKAAEDEELRSLFQEHLEQTRGQILRLERVFEQVGKTARGEKCEGMAGIIEEGQSVIDQDAEPETMDAMLIGAAQKAEHYEIASYGTMCAWAEQLGMRDAASLLQQNLAEEKETDQKLTAFAEQRKNAQAAQGTMQ